MGLATERFYVSLTITRSIANLYQIDTYFELRSTQPPVWRK